MALFASAEDRIYLKSSWRLNKRRFGLFLLACLLLHIVVLSFLILRSDQIVLIEPEAIPVEVVPEPEPQPEEQKQEDEKPEEKKQEEEKPEEKKPEPPPEPQYKEDPATDAARQLERQAEELRREKTAPEPEPQPKPEPAQPEAPAEQVPPLEEMSQEALPQQVAPQEAPPMPPLPQRPEKSFAEKFGTFQPVPDMEFEAAAPRTPMSGQAANSYNATLYGMIVPLVRIPPRPPGGGAHRGQVGFQIDGNGKLVWVGLMQPSGIPELDASAIAAVRKAAPFPRPPGGAPVQLYFSYSPR